MAEGESEKRDSRKDTSEGPYQRFSEAKEKSATPSTRHEEGGAQIWHQVPGSGGGKSRLIISCPLPDAYHIARACNLPMKRDAAGPFAACSGRLCAPPQLGLRPGWSGEDVPGKCAGAYCREEGVRRAMLRAQVLLKRLHQSRADNSFGNELVRLIRPPVLVIDDFGLQRLNPIGVPEPLRGDDRKVRQGLHHHDERQARGRADGPVRHPPANSLLDRLTHNAHLIIIEGESYRKRMGLKKNKPQRN